MEEECLEQGRMVVHDRGEWMNNDMTSTTFEGDSHSSGVIVDHIRY